MKTRDKNSNLKQGESQMKTSTEKQIRSVKIKNTKRKNNIKQLREEAEIFLRHISEIEKHHNNRGYHSILWPVSSEEENIPIDGADISVEYLKAWKRLEKVIKESVEKITI
tara:strand:+ start:23 stop:355 length:333 start_codon:yes stop_codon:yes gene_type:complete